jgi:hypothetical protein
MRFQLALRLFPSGAVLLGFGLGLIGFAGGCNSSVNQPSSPATVDRRIPEGWEKTKQAMMERMKQMRKRGGPERGANRH